MKRTVGPLEIRTGGPMKKGEKVHGHKHNFDHVTYCAAGALAVRALNDDGTVRLETRIKAGTVMNSHVLIAAGVMHELEALEDGTVYHCQYAHRDWNGKVVPKYDGNEMAYV